MSFPSDQDFSVDFLLRWSSLFIITIEKTLRAKFVDKPFHVILKYPHYARYSIHHDKHSTNSLASNCSSNYPKCFQLGPCFTGHHYTRFYWISLELGTMKLTQYCRTAIFTRMLHFFKLWLDAIWWPSNWVISFIYTSNNIVHLLSVNASVTLLFIEHCPLPHHCAHICNVPLH